jgi:hypothetical protein
MIPATPSPVGEKEPQRPVGSRFGSALVSHAGKIQDMQRVVRDMLNRLAV